MQKMQKGNADSQKEKGKREKRKAYIIHNLARVTKGDTEWEEIYTSTIYYILVRLMRGRAKWIWDNMICRQDTTRCKLTWADEKTRQDERRLSSDDKTCAFRFSNCPIYYSLSLLWRNLWRPTDFSWTQNVDTVFHIFSRKWKKKDMEFKAI